MSGFKTILACLTSRRAAAELIPPARAVAERFDAHLVGIHAIDAIVPYPGIALHVDHPRFAALLETFQAENTDVREAFLEGTRTMVRPAEWRSVPARSGSSAPALIRSAYRSDLVMGLLPDLANEDLDEVFVQNDLINEAGRPVLLVPQGWQERSIGQRIMIAWKPTREAARAVHESLPFLALADSVTILTVSSDPETSETSAEGHELARMLSRHDVACTVRHAAPGDDGIGVCIRLEAAHDDSDLIVMGACGHSRLRRIILGDATDEVLRQSDLPVLFST